MPSQLHLMDDPSALMDAESADTPIADSVRNNHPSSPPAGGKNHKPMTLTGMSTFQWMNMPLSGLHCFGMYDEACMYEIL